MVKASFRIFLRFIDVPVKPAPLVLFLIWAAAFSITSLQGAAPIRWPRSFTNDGTTFTIYQPQITSWSKNVLTARVALSVQQTVSFWGQD